MDEIENGSEPKSAVEAQTHGSETSVERMPATLLSREGILKGAEALTAHLPVQEVGIERDMVMPKEWATPGVELPKIYYGHTRRHGHMDDPDAGMTLDVITYPSSEAQPELSRSRADVEIGRDNPDGGRNVLEVKVGGTRAELEHSTIKEHRLRPDQVEAGITIHTMSEMTTQLTQHKRSHPDAGSLLTDPAFRARLELARVQVVRQGDLMEGDAQQVARALAELQRRQKQ
jgi:hypothetical protein